MTATLLMDTRHRAMLLEMGIRVWQPLPKSDTKPDTKPDEKPNPKPGPKQDVKPDTKPHTNTPSALPVNVQLDRTDRINRTSNATNPAAWQVGTLQTLYADTAVKQAPSWLVLLEAPADALLDQYSPLDGDAGKLLDNMLRAAGLPQAGTVVVMPLVRGVGGSSSVDLAAALKENFARAQADVVLLMGRLAAQAVLQSTEPLARLRGQIHTVLGRPTVVVLEPDYLLRNLPDKAKAWDDLCLARSVVSLDSIKRADST